MCFRCSKIKRSPKDNGFRTKWSSFQGEGFMQLAKTSSVKIKVHFSKKNSSLDFYEPRPFQRHTATHCHESMVHLVLH